MSLLKPRALIKLSQYAFSKAFTCCICYYKNGTCQAVNSLFNTPMGVKILKQVERGCDRWMGSRYDRVLEKKDRDDSEGRRLQK